MNRAKLCLFLLFIFLGASAFSSDFSFELNPYTGISYGQFDEFVYSSADSSIVRSKLEWETKPLFKLGFGAKIGIKKLFLEGEGSFALPLSCGILHDSDWSEDGAIKHTYSLLEENLENFFACSAMFHYDFDIEQVFFVCPSLLADYSHLKIKGKNGEGWFASSSYSATGKDELWNSGHARYYPKGKLNGINYERYAFNLFAGINFRAKMTEKFSAELGFFIAPFSYVSVFDTHLAGKSQPDYHLNEYAFDKFSCCKMVLGSQYNFSSTLALNCSVDFTASKILKDSLYHNYNSENTVKSNQLAGTSFFSIDVKLGIKIKIIS